MKKKSVELERLEVLNEGSESNDNFCRELQDFAELACGVETSATRCSKCETEGAHCWAFLRRRLRSRRPSGSRSRRSH